MTDSGGRSKVSSFRIILYSEIAVPFSSDGAVQEIVAEFAVRVFT